MSQARNSTRPSTRPRKHYKCPLFVRKLGRLLIICCMKEQGSIRLSQQPSLQGSKTDTLRPSSLSFELTELKSERPYLRSRSESPVSIEILAKRYIDSSPGPRPFLINRISSLGPGPPAVLSHDQELELTDRSSTETSKSPPPSTSTSVAHESQGRTIIPSLIREDAFDQVEADLLKSSIFTILMESAKSSYLSLQLPYSEQLVHNLSPFNRSFPGHSSCRVKQLTLSRSLDLMIQNGAGSEQYAMSVVSAATSDPGSSYSTADAGTGSVDATRTESCKSTVEWRSVRISRPCQYQRSL